jgi:uncharacterized protein YigA (DUF484 family)
MSNASTDLAVDEARRLESSILKARLLSLGVAAVALAFLPWSYPRWLQAAFILTWFVQGIVAAMFVRRASEARQVQAAGRALMAADTVLMLVMIRLFLPTLPEAWIAMLVPLIWAGVREGVSAAAAVAVVTTVLLAAALWLRWMPPAGEPLAGRFAFDAGIVWMAVLAVRQLVWGVSRRNQILATQQTQLAQALKSQQTLRVRADAQAATLKKVTELAVSLLRERQLDALLERILDVTLTSFGFRAGSLLLAERESECYRYHVVRGYPESVTRRLQGATVPFAVIELKIDKRFAIRPEVFYAPVERQTWYTDPERCYAPSRVDERRAAPGAWHEADTLMFTLRSSAGETIGLLIPDAPADGRIPNDDTIDTIALFARLAAAAIENIHLFSSEKSRAKSLSEENLEIRRLYASLEALAEERRLEAERLARILELTAAIFRERNLSHMLKRILRVAIDSFGFSAGSIVLYDPRRKVYVRHAAVGYAEGVEGAEVPAEDVERYMTAQTRVRETFYYVPMELNLEGGITRHPERLTLPRIQPGDWHESDVLLFPIFDSAGAMIGVLCPDDPKDRRLPREETIRTIEVFAQLAGIAVESARLRDAVGQQAAAGL